MKIKPHILAPVSAKQTPLIFALLASHFALLVHAAVPLRWTVETSRVQPAVFDVVHGESIELEADMQSYGNPLSMAGKPVFIFWHTNGMNTAWWSAPATVRGAPPRPGVATPTNVLAATFTPAMDPGAPTVTGFIGATGDIYRAAFTLRFRKGPGAVPNAITMPPPVLDLANTTVINPPWPTQADFANTTTVMRAELKTYVDGQIESAGLITHESVTNAAGTVASNVVTKAYVESLGIESGLDTNAVREISLDITKSASVTNAGAVEAANNYTDKKQDRFVAKSPLLLENKYYKWTENDVVICYTKEWGNEEAWSTEAYADESCTEPYISGAYCTVEIPVGEYGKYRLHEQGTGWISGYLLDHPEEKVGSELSINATTLSGYGITDAYTRNQSDARYAPTGTAVTVASHTSQLTQMSQSLSGKAEATTVVQLSQSLSGKADAATVAQLNVQVQALGANANAEDARVIVTNYNSSTKMPEAQFDVKVSNSWITVWHEMTRWNWFLGGFSTYTNGVASTLANKGEKEWGWFDSATGNPSPEGILQLSQPRIQVCSGAAYQRYVSTTGSVWVLESNGLVADINGTTNGYFRITDEKGNAHFEIVKGDKQSLFATAKTMTQQQMGVTHYFTTYAITNAVTTPVAQFSRSLNPATWIKETESGCPCNVSWTNNGDNSWTVEWWPIGNEPTLFMMAGYEKGGETYIRNVVPVKMQYIYLGNTKYLLGTATISGHTVLTLTAQ